jgi:hypothetical protein
VIKRLAARLVTGPFAFFVAWLIDLVILLRQLRAQRMTRGSRSWRAAALERARERISWLTR